MRGCLSAKSILETRQWIRFPECLRNLQLCARPLTPDPSPALGRGEPKWTSRSPHRPEEHEGTERAVACDGNRDPSLPGEHRVLAAARGGQSDAGESCEHIQHIMRKVQHRKKSKP